ncbi:MAG: Fic family protein [Bradyrhizobiaceae bacterium]|nr:MAG: Fic family protein [Bradyrhizobiaceae bacterium]
MILFELFGDERNAIYQALEISNGARQYNFLNSIVLACVEAKKPFLSQHIIKALNFQAITCLHVNAGEYRPCAVTVGIHRPPEHYRVPALMDDFVNEVNRNWGTTDPVVLATYVLWRLNHIHPFINGNGRTARAACYFILCVTSGGWLKGEKILPELINENHDEYTKALVAADASLATGTFDMSQLHAFVSRLLNEQLQSAAPAANTP